MYGFEISQEDVRAARALIQWSQGDLAKAASVGVSTIADFEKGMRTPIANNLDAIRRAFEGAGVTFTPTGPAIFGEGSLYFMMESDSGELRFRYRLDHALAVQEIIATFGKVDGNSVELSMEQLVTPALRTALDGLIAKHGSTVPQLNKLKQKIGKLGDGEYFLLMPAGPTSTADRFRLENHLHVLNHPGEQPIDSGPENIFSLLLERYNMKNPRTDRRTVIGVGQQLRTCRFCHRTAEKGATFRKVAHVIPTALGNDHLKSTEECDDCNEYFGGATEPSLIAMLNLQRVFLGTQGRGKQDGRPKLKFSGATIMNDGEKVVLQAGPALRNENGTFEVDLGRGAPLVPMAVYRALVKIALSVVDEVQLPHLRETIEWVRHALHSEKPLPLVAMSTINLPPDPSAQITVYTRREPHPRLPHIVGEFRLGCYMFAFAVPFSAEDQWDLVGFFDDSTFRETFQHYMLAAQWVQQDLSGTAQVVPAPRLRFVRR